MKAARTSMITNVILLQILFLDELFANVTPLLTSITGLRIERHHPKADLSLGMKRLPLAPFLVTLSENIIFTCRLPWLDVFAMPPGW
jgi:hypothetical protein